MSYINENKIEDEFIEFWDTMKDKVGLGEYSDEVTRFWIGKLKQALEEQREETSKVTRVEVIDNKGRSYVNWDENNNVESSLQDDGRTLKVFINKK